jgi:general secretion pathway protein D
VRNREKAKVLIGEKLPVFTSTAVQNAGVSTSVSYIDIGLKLEVEPQVYLDDEVGIKMNIEVNSNLGPITDKVTGASAYDVGTRTATTVLRLHDGETQVLAGLINDNDRATLSKVPGLGDIPGIGRLFTDENSTRDKSEIVMLITPRIIRNLVTPDYDTLVLAAGTDAQPGAAPLAIGRTAPRSMTVSAAPGASVPAARGGRPPARADQDTQTAPGAGESGQPAPAPAQPGQPPLAAVQPGNLSVTIKAPEQASLGGNFTVTVELPDAGAAVDGDVTLGFEPSMLQAPGPATGRASVHLSQFAPGILSGSVAFRAVGSGAGSASIAFAEGHVRLPDGSQPPLSGSSVTVNIGL